MAYYFVATFYVLSCFVLMLVVLIQQGKGGDLASAFGGGSSQAAFGARAGATLLTKVTWVCAAFFIIGALGLSIIGHRGPSSVLGSVPLPKAPAQSSVPAPSVPKPATPPAPAAQPPAAPATQPPASQPKK
jgi:preprotein translocase subunit SecG